MQFNINISGDSKIGKIQLQKKYFKPFIHINNHIKKEVKIKWVFLPSDSDELINHF